MWLDECGVEELECPALRSDLNTTEQLQEEQEDQVGKRQ